MAERDDEELSWWDALRAPSSGEEETTPDSSWPSPSDDSFNALARVQSLFRQPLFGEGEVSRAPTLRDAASEKFRSAGLFGNTTPRSPAPDPGGSAPDDYERPPPPSWKLPVRGTLPTILGDDTAAGLGQGAAPNIGSAASSAPPREPAAPGASSPLDHPNAQTGLALTAADALITRGIDLAITLAGSNPALAPRLVEMAGDAIAGVLPQEFRASALTSAGAAAAEAERRIGDNARATRTRAAIGTLVYRRTEAEHDHTHAILGGDRGKIAEARRDAIEAWSAERRARGDGEAEINAGARALERKYRKSALRHRLAQLDGAGIDRALSEDEDAKADPALAHEVAEDIRQIRREDPARVGEVSNERKIAERKRDGRIDTPEAETHERYKLRLDAQAQRGIPEDRRRLLTNAERTALAHEYHRIESANGRATADKWLDEQMQQAGPHAQRFKTEIAAPPRDSVQWRELDQAPAPSQRPIAELPGIAGDAPRPSEADQGRVEPAQDNKHPAAPPAPGSPRLPPATEAERSAREEDISKEISERHSALPRDDWRARIDLIVEISKREGFVPFIVRQRLWGQIVTADRRVSIEERLASAHAIAELQRLFPQDIERHLEKGDLAVIAEIVRLDEEGKTDADKIVDTAKKNAGYPDFRLIFGAIGGMRGGRSVRRETRPLTPEELARKQRQMNENRTVGGIAEEQGRQIIIRDIERMKVSAWPKRLVRIAGDGGTIPDLPIGTNSDQIRLYVDVKKYGARHPEPQRSRLRALGAHIVEINPNNGDMRALAPPYERWISYEEWLRLAEKLLSQEPR